MKKWVQNVKTVSTFPPAGTFKKSARTIARTLAKPEVSPRGLGSAIRMVQYFINRGGKNIPACQKGELEKAKHLLQDMREPSAKTSKGQSAKASKQRGRKSTTRHARQAHAKRG